MRKDLNNQFDAELVDPPEAPNPTPFGTPAPPSFFDKFVSAD